jgi:hypothetical protein
LVLQFKEDGHWKCLELGALNMIETETETLDPVFSIEVDGISSSKGFKNGMWVRLLKRRHVPVARVWDGRGQMSGGARKWWGDLWTC